MWRNSKNAFSAVETATETGLNATISIFSVALIGGSRNGSDWWYGSAESVATGSGSTVFIRMQMLCATFGNTDSASV